MKTVRFFVTILLLCAIVTACRQERQPIETVDLLKKFRLGDLRLDTPIIDIGKAAFRRYLTQGWGEDRTEKDGTTSAVVATRSAELDFYCLSSQDRVLVVKCKMESGTAEAQSLDILINSRRVAKRAIKSAYKEYSIPIPAKLLSAGVNQIRFVLSINRSKSTRMISGISFDYVALLPQGGQLQVSEADPAEIGLTSISQREKKTALRAPADSIISFYERIPSGAELHVEYGLFPNKPSRGAVARFSVEVEPEDGSREQLFSETLSRGYFRTPEESKSLSLKKYENRIVRISLQSGTVANQLAPSRIYWSKAQLISPKATPEVKKEQRQKAAAKRPNVILYLMDALRADHLQPYGYARPTSPRIQQFAHESVVFERAYAQTAWTRASLATIMTGLYPSSHLTETRLDRLPDFIPTLARELKSNGYSTHGFVTNGNVSAAFNFHLHYDNYVQFREKPKTKQIHVQSDELFQHVSDFVNQSLREPVYLYVHATDPHEPYTPAPFQLDLPARCDPNDPKMIRPATKYGEEAYDDSAINCLIALYDSEILKADYYFGQFLDLLKQKRLYENSIIILTADHGEEFLEHGAFKHGQTLYEAEIRIPILIHFPAESGLSGKRVQSYARHVDILPTILDVISATIPPGVQGTSLMERIRGKTFEGPVFGELLLDKYTGKYMILHPYKLLETGKGRSAQLELFHLVDDPQEKKDLSKENPVRFGYMKSLLQEWSEEQQSRKAMLKKPRGAVLDKETEEALRALGYLQ